MTDAAEIVRLAACCETATADEERDWLQQAFYALNPAPECGSAARHGWVVRSNRFHGLCVARAYLDAAVTLIKSGKWSLTAQGDSGGWEAWAWSGDQTPDWRAAATPALAITASCLRARAASALSDGEG